MLSDKIIVLGVTGSIAAYKAADLASKLVQAGARVEVIMTESAVKFITPVTFRSLTKRPVVTSMWELTSEFSIEHVALAEAADVVVIAPATANVIARLAGGIADDMLTCTVLATKAPIVIAPAMHAAMFENAITQENLAKLKARGFTVVGPAYGRLASGGVGLGRLAEVEKIIGTINQVLGRGGDLAGRHIVVTAGGTQETIDPVRFIGNRSTGKMGFAVAEAARDRGAKVTLITAPTSLPEPAGIELIRVESAVQMKEAVVKAVAQADALIMAAAVADYQPKTVTKEKIKKEAAGASLSLELTRTPDILAEVKGNFIRVGFAAETEDVVENARRKLAKKQLDLIAANDVTSPDSGFAVDTNRVTLISRDGKEESLPLMSKREVADEILDRVRDLMRSKSPQVEILIKLKPAYVKYGYIRIGRRWKDLFPTFLTMLELEVELEGGRKGAVQVNFYPSGPGIRGKALKAWFGEHPELGAGDKVRVTVIEPMKKYRLEIVK